MEPGRKDDAPASDRPASDRLSSSRVSASRLATSRLATSRLASWRFGVHAVLAFAAVALLAAPFGVLVLLLRERAGWLHHADVDVADDLHSVAREHPLYTDALRTISFIGSAPIWVAVLGATALWLVHRRLYRLAAFVVVTGAFGGVLNAAIKAAVGRARPSLRDPVASASGNSFPSGHTQSAVVGCGILLLVFLPVIARRWRIVFAGLAVLFAGLVGFSRIALGVHYLSDVVGGVIVGLAWLMLMAAAFSAWRQDLGEPPSDPTEGLDPEHADELA